MASNIKIKEGADKEEGLRLAFNSRLYNNLAKGPNGYRYLDCKIEADNLIDNWFVNNLEGLPEKIEKNVD